ncbi:MAG: VWA domain-containing protein, partial [Clostridia bacterium]|nr:VWA domain-containing protein [Clostridia bacterium]
MKNSIFRRSLAVILTVAILFATLPMGNIFAATEPNFYDKVVDASSIDGWKEFFPVASTQNNPLSTENAGGVWTDKSVFTNADGLPGNIPMIDGDKNFLTALSAIAANKEIVGYSTIPTDTVLVLDLSASMSNSNSESALINSANDAISRLLAANSNNRVGVVLYSASGSTGASTYNQSVTRLLPIDRYTTARDNRYISLSGGRVSVDRDVRGTVANADLDNTKSFGGGTYIQAGLYEALQMFEEMDTVIGDNNWQSGDNRMPILVLMSDGACSTGTTDFANVGRSNVGNGNESGLRPGNAFLTQLTASYVINSIEAHYQKENPDVRGLFYTLGFNIGNNAVAQAVMNPDQSTYTDALWTAYNQVIVNPFTGAVNNARTFSVKNTDGGSSDVTIYKNSYANSKSYVDKYFGTSADLATAFKDIVDEIILQSRYYPTHLEGGSPDFSGYVEFTDTLGEYMEVKHISGILLGDTLFDGHMMASKLADTSENGLGTPENPTDLGDEFIWAVQTRLGITNVADARALVAAAYNAGQLSYRSDTDWSNYIGWYANAEGKFIAHWDEDPDKAAPAGAVYKIRSYGFLGETTGSIKNSDMMYMSVQVKTDIATGAETVSWKIPAALVPMVTYLVEVDGNSVDTATNVRLRVEDEEVAPIRLVYETGLRSDLNQFNITRITDEEHIAADGHTRIFWNNYFNIDAPSHDDHVTAVSEFTPNKENERFYYTFDSAVHKKVGNDYQLVTENEGLDVNGTYYHRRYVFSASSDEPIFFYEQMSKASIQAAIDNGFNDNFESLEQ